MGMCWVLKEEVEEDMRNIVDSSGISGSNDCHMNVFDEDQLDQVEELVSLPFQVDFYIPVVKVTCGDAFSGLLTAEGQVHTWGYNHYGALGIDQE